MAWKRLGRIFVPDGSKPWARSHASLPVASVLDAATVRIFHSTRDDTRRSYVGWVDVDLSGVASVIAVGAEPTLQPGEDGAFDDSGIGLGCITPIEAGYRLYYMGWNLGVRAPWRNSIGMAENTTLSGRFSRFSLGPLLDRSIEDPYTLSYPWVLRLAPDDWRMWYGSNLTWGASSADMSHVIKAARSIDGVRWERTGTTVLGFENAGEYALARPTVTMMGEVFVMCFAVRGEAYRIGAAFSRDGECWTRCDDMLGLEPSGDGWESKACCYPCLFWFGDRLWLAYNGNGYGETGLGLAVWDGPLNL